MNINIIQYDDLNIIKNITQNKFKIITQSKSTKKLNNISHKLINMYIMVGTFGSEIKKKCFILKQEYLASFK